MENLATPVEGKTDKIKHNTSIDIGLRLHLHGVLRSFDRRISKTGEKTYNVYQDEQQGKQWP